MVGSPNKELAVLEQINQGPVNHSVVLNELPVITYESKETVELLDITWLWLGLHNGNL